MQSLYFVAEKLGKMVWEVENLMTAEEFDYWIIHFNKQASDSKKAMKKGNKR